MLTGTFKALQANNFFTGFCPNSRISQQQEKFASPATCVKTKLTLVVNVGFICRILCFEVLKVLFSKLVDRMFKNESLHE